VHTGIAQFLWVMAPLALFALYKGGLDAAAAQAQQTKKSALALLIRSLWYMVVLVLLLYMFIS